jgi:hypothetical protein
VVDGLDFCNFLELLLQLLSDIANSEVTTSEIKSLNRVRLFNWLITYASVLSVVFYLNFVSF